jgi:uncharacterized membrane protein
MLTKHWTKDNRWAIVICLLFFIFWFNLLAYKYLNLAYYDWDLAFFTQACWQLLHGSQFTSVTGINYFGDHSYFITFLYLPFFALAPHPLTLVILKLIAFLVAAYLFYKIAYEVLGQSTALVLMVLYILFPANIFSILYEFNPESFAPPVLFWMYMAFQNKQWRSFLAASLVLMLIKENMCLLVCTFSLYGLFKKNFPPKIAWFNFLLGVVVFTILVMDVVPYFRHLSYHPFVVRYSYLGGSIAEIIFNLFTHPLLIFKVLFNRVNGQYIQALFGPLLLPSLLSWQILFLAAPVLLQHLLSSQYAEHTIYYHYGTTIVPFIFLATMRTINMCYKKINPRIYMAMLVILFIASILILISYSRQFWGRLNYHHDHLNNVRWSFVDAIPPQEGVIATFDYLAPLSLRGELYVFHKVYDESYQDPEHIKLNELNTGKPFVLPDRIHYALIDYKDLWLQDALKRSPKVTSERINAFLKNGHWKLIKHYGSIVLLKR